MKDKKLAQLETEVEEAEKRKSSEMLNPGLLPDAMGAALWGELSSKAHEEHAKAVEALESYKKSLEE